MEIMEDGNLVDRVRILLQRDMQYYQDMQTVLREPLCVRVSGGKLDFPRHASFAAIKIVTWWEAEFLITFRKTSGLTSDDHENLSHSKNGDEVLKKVQPSEFFLLVHDTAEQLLEHLHTLIQEALDHADLAVLTATMGAAALMRNCLRCYNQHAKGTTSSETSEKINKSYKAYNEMAEAVAEKLLDLHCRLISLYILNEADSLSWHSNKSFFERERCSYVVQMWWLYMQGTKADLWNTVSPRMAQRVFAGMLNESLSILTCRFIYGRPSLARSEQFWTDAFNVLCCTGYLALGACTNGDEMLGTRLNILPTVVRDLHAKCNELLICLLLRGTPLKELYQTFRHGLENLTILQSRRGPAPWLLICAPNLLGQRNSDVDITSLPEERAVVLELNVLRHQPQPNWSQLIKVISMNSHCISKMLLNTLIRQCIGFVEEWNTSSKTKEKTCGGFLCSQKDCLKSLRISSSLALYSLMHILSMTVDCPANIIVPALKQDPKWAHHLDRQQVWNQFKPPWLNSILDPLRSMMTPVADTLLTAVKTGASVYQAMSIALGCFTELYPTVGITVLRIALALDDNIPAHCHPIGGSVLLQIMCATLYTILLEMANREKESSNVTNTIDKSSVAIALAEAICSIDEDNKHTTQINYFLSIVRQSVNTTRRKDERLKTMSSIIDVQTDELLFTNTGRRSLKVVHEYVVKASDWLLKNLRRNEGNRSLDIENLPSDSPTKKPLTYIMFHIEDMSFDQFLIDYEQTNWKRVLTMPLSISLERAHIEILLRPEFKDVGQLSQEDREAVDFIKRLCSSFKVARFE